MDKKQRINEAFNYLKDKGKVHTQKDMANMMHATSPNVSSALKGVESVLTDNFLKRFNAAFGNIFNEKWLLTGEGEMLSPSVSQTVSGDNNTAVAGNGNHVEGGGAMAALVAELAAQRKITEEAQRLTSQAMEQYGKAVEQSSKAMEQSGKAMEQSGKAMEQSAKAQEQIDRLISIIEKKLSILDNKGINNKDDNK